MSYAFEILTILINFAEHVDVNKRFAWMVIAQKCHVVLMKTFLKIRNLNSMLRKICQIDKKPNLLKSVA